MQYATADDVSMGFRELSSDEHEACLALLEEAGSIIDAFCPSANQDIKNLVSCRMVRRVLGDGSGAAALYPMGASQGSASAMGYTQSWTMSGGSSGELYLSKLEKKLLGYGNRAGSHSPVEDMIV